MTPRRFRRRTQTRPVPLGAAWPVPLSLLLFPPFRPFGGAIGPRLPGPPRGQCAARTPDDHEDEGFNAISPCPDAGTPEVPAEPRGSGPRRADRGHHRDRDGRLAGARVRG